MLSLPADIAFLSALELKEAYARRDLSPVEVTEAVLARAAEQDGLVGSLATVTEELARAQARSSEAAWREGRQRKLEGVPTTIKDVQSTRGIRTMRGSRLWQDWVPDSDAPVVERIYDAGAVVIGKTNTPELGWKANSTNRVSPPTRNPFALDRTAGGSSGGAAAAVATGLGPLAQGGDGGGSIRIPASFSGVFGLKPTFGVVPGTGAINEQLATYGPLSRTVRDAALFIEATGGFDPRDRTSSLRTQSGLVEACDKGARGLRVAWSEGLCAGRPEPEVLEVASAAARVFEELGCLVEEATPDLPDFAKAVDDLFSTGYAAILGENFDEIADDLDPGLRAVVEHGLTVPGPAVAAAHLTRLDVYERVRQFFMGYDLLLTPTVSVLPFPLGEDFPAAVNGRLQGPYSWLWFTSTFNLSGNPAASVPAGLSRSGLPVGLQIVGPLHADALVLQAAAAFEAARPWLRELRDANERLAVQAESIPA